MNKEQSRREFLAAALFAPVAAVAIVKGKPRAGDVYVAFQARIDAMKPGTVVSFGADGASGAIREAYDKETKS